jgi:hypothetical protein
MTEIEQKTGITDAECEFLDRFYTENTFEPGPNLLNQGIKQGTAQKTLSLSDLDIDAAEYLRIQAQQFHKSQAAVINDLIREKIAVDV